VHHPRHPTVLRYMSSPSIATGAMRNIVAQYVTHSPFAQTLPLPTRKPNSPHSTATATTRRYVRYM
jgi:hypothetical protein